MGRGRPGGETVQYSAALSATAGKLAAYQLTEELALSDYATIPQFALKIFKLKFDLRDGLP